MLQNYGCQNMVNPIRRILVKHVTESYQDQKLLEQTFASLNYFEVPNFSKAVLQYQKFISLLNKFEIPVHGEFRQFLERVSFSLFSRIYF